MAQLMAQRQVVAPKPQLTQKQSTETVQVMLYTSASMLCRIRGIFPSLAFEVVEFAEDDELYTFEGLMNNKHPCRAQPPSPSSTSTRSSEVKTLEAPLLRRGRSIRADQFLDSLNTAFEALHRGTLHALRIPFMGDPDVNSNSLELWSFRVIYKQSAEGGREVQGLEANLGSEETYDPSLCVIDLLDRVSEQCERLPQLPDDRYIQPSILYKNDGWEPKGYVETRSQPSVQGFAGWQPYNEDLGIIGGLYHDLAIRVASLKHEHSSTRRISQDLQSRKPGEIRGAQRSARTSTVAGRYSPVRSRTVSPTLDKRNSVASVIPETPQRLDRLRGDRMSSAVSHALEEATSKLLTNAAVPSKKNISQNQTVKPATWQNRLQSDISSASQIDDDMRRRSSLDNMLMPSSNREDDFATQVRRNASQVSSDENTPSPDLAEHMKTYDFLSSETAQHLWIVKCEVQRRPDMTLTNEVVTSCRCQLDDLMENMARCSICCAQQHSICQGYLEDSRQPSQHVCHLCLFGPKIDKATRTKLYELALERRAMDLILTGEVDNAVDLSRKLDMQFDKVAVLVTSLNSREFIVEQSGRSTRNTQGKITLPDSVGTPEYIDALAKLFDPYQVVGHHFSNAAVSSDSATDVAQTLRARYRVLTPLPSKVTPGVTPKHKRAMTAIASLRATGSATATTKKRSRTSQPEALEMSEQATPVRQSSRVRTPTPKMKEAKFSFFINGQNLPSREHPKIKSKRFKGDS
ncbi:hypothetical protein QM012_006084 [Aureobasidium pullulans]|uniref:HORMA domain-containing protein n=1 Tax=Aureobasidium pullulans TaxID=5580 RepID=A0ABR0TSD7_AURPU